MTDLIWPSDIGPRKVGFYCQPYTGGSESPFTRQMKTYGLAAPRWITKLTFLSDDGVAAFPLVGPRLDALLARLRGRQNRVALYDFRRPLPRGTAAGATMNVSDTAAAGSTTITLNGARAGSAAFLEGDYLGFAGGLLIMSVTTAVSNGAGQVTVTFEPPLKRDVAAGEGVTLYAPCAWFKLTSDDAGDNEAEIGTPATITLELVEDL